MSIPREKYENAKKKIEIIKYLLDEKNKMAKEINFIKKQIDEIKNYLFFNESDRNNETKLSYLINKKAALEKKIEKIEKIRMRYTHYYYDIIYPYEQENIQQYNYDDELEEDFNFRYRGYSYTQPKKHPDTKSWRMEDYEEGFKEREPKDFNQFVADALQGAVGSYDHPNESTEEVANFYKPKGFEEAITPKDKNYKDKVKKMTDDILKEIDQLKILSFSSDVKESEFEENLIKISKMFNNYYEIILEMNEIPERYREKYFGINLDYLFSELQHFIMMVSEIEYEYNKREKTIINGKKVLNNKIDAKKVINSSNISPEILSLMEIDPDFFDEFIVVDDEISQYLFPSDGLTSLPSEILYVSPTKGIEFNGRKPPGSYLEPYKGKILYNGHPIRSVKQQFDLIDELTRYKDERTKKDWKNKFSLILPNRMDDIYKIYNEEIKPIEDMQSDYLEYDQTPLTPFIQYVEYLDTVFDPYRMSGKINAILFLLIKNPNLTKEQIFENFLSPFSTISYMHVSKKTRGEYYKTINEFSLFQILCLESIDLIKNYINLYGIRKTLSLKEEIIENILEKAYVIAWKLLMRRIENVYQIELASAFFLNFAADVRRPPPSIFKKDVLFDFFKNNFRSGVMDYEKDKDKLNSPKKQLRGVNSMNKEIEMLKKANYLDKKGKIKEADILERKAAIYQPELERREKTKLLSIKIGRAHV